MPNLDRFYKDRVSIYRMVMKSDKFGGVTKAKELIANNVMCRIYDASKARGYMKIQAEGQVALDQSKMVCNEDVDVMNGDVIVNAVNGRVYNVVKAEKMYRAELVSHTEVHMYQRASDGGTY